MEIVYRLLISNRVGWTPNANIISHRKERPAGDEGEVYLLTGIDYQADSTTLLCEFQWIDNPPAGGKFLADLMESTSDASESSGGD